MLLIVVDILARGAAGIFSADEYGNREIAREAISFFIKYGPEKTVEDVVVPAGVEQVGRWIGLQLLNLSVCRCRNQGGV